MPDSELLVQTLKSIHKPIPCVAHGAISEYGRLGSIIDQLSAISGSPCPPIKRRAVAIFASDHGVASEGVSLYPQQVTQQMVANFVAGGAGINAMARVANASLCVIDVGVQADLTHLATSGKIRDQKIAWGTGNIVRGPAMSRPDALRALGVGIRMAKELSGTHDILVTGEKGIGNTTPSAAVISVLLQRDPLEVTGRGTGLDEKGRQRKAAKVREAIGINAPDPQDPIDVLAKLGGFDMAAMAGFYLGAAACRKPVVLDGFISGAAALIASRLHPHCVAYFLAGHRSEEQGHRFVLEELGLEPLLDLGFRLGEATGATLALCILDAAQALLTQPSPTTAAL